MIRRVAAPERARRLDELPLPQRQHLAAHDAGHRRPAEEPDDQDGDDQARPGDRHQRDGDQQERHRQHDVDQAGPGRCRPRRRGSRPPGRRTTPITTVSAVASDADEQRDPGAVGDPDQDVAAEVVGAEPELAVRGHAAARRGQAGVAVLLVRRVPGEVARTAARRPPSATISDDDHERDHRDPVPAQPLPGERPRAAALDGPRRGAGRAGLGGRSWPGSEPVTGSSSVASRAGAVLMVRTAISVSSISGVPRTGPRRRQRVEAGRPVCRRVVERPAPAAGRGVTQSARAFGQRVWNRHPDGGFGRRRAGRRRGRSARGCRRRPGRAPGAPTAGRACRDAGSRLNSSSAGAISTILPRYITAIRSLTCRTTDRSWEMNT